VCPKKVVFPVSITKVAVLIALGFACALGVYAYMFLKARRTIIARFADLQERWCALERRTRRQIHGTQRRGQAPPVEHAAIALEVLDAADEALGDAKVLRRRLQRTWLSYGAVMIMGVLLIAVAHDGLGVVAASYSATLASITAISSARGREFRRNRQAARAATLAVLDARAEG